MSTLPSSSNGSTSRQSPCQRSQFPMVTFSGISRSRVCCTTTKSTGPAASGRPVTWAVVRQNPPCACRHDWNLPISKGSNSVHPIGQPMNHSSHSGFRRPVFANFKRSNREGCCPSSKGGASFLSLTADCCWSSISNLHFVRHALGLVELARSRPQSKFFRVNVGLQSGQRPTLPTAHRTPPRPNHQAQFQVLEQ